MHTIITYNCVHYIHEVMLKNDLSVVDGTKFKYCYKNSSYMMKHVKLCAFILKFYLFLMKHCK